MTVNPQEVVLREAASWVPEQLTPPSTLELFLQPTVWEAEVHVLTDEH